jgi:hypothetical protein
LHLPARRSRQNVNLFLREPLHATFIYLQALAEDLRYQGFIRLEKIDSSLAYLPFQNLSYNNAP